jgi:AcrR family transcriptional regulator
MAASVATRRAKGRAREEAVLHATAQAIAELGLANVRVSDIAQRAGIGTGHVTYYFPSKSDLLMRAFRWSEEGLHHQIEQQIGRISDPWKRLDRLFELAASAGPGDPGWVLWFEVWAKAGTDRSVAEGSDESEAWWRVALSDAIRYGCDRGSFAADDLDEVVLALSALIDGLSIQLTLGAGGLSRSRLLVLCLSAAHRYLDPPAVSAAHASHQDER